MKVLIVEDEKDLSDSISDYLSNEQFICEKAYDFESARYKISGYEYSCIILDIGLPGGSGLQLLTELKENNKMEGILIISAKDSLEDKVLGLKTGADDYLAKPFYLPELAARVAAIIRRKTFNGKNVLNVGAFELDLNAKTAKYNDVLIELTKKEYELLVYFVNNKNRVITKNAITEHLWGDDLNILGTYDFIYTHIKNLRKKIISSGGPDCIKSVYGMGYKFKDYE